MINFQCMAMPFDFFLEGLLFTGLRTTGFFAVAACVRANALSSEVSGFFLGRGGTAYLLNSA